MALATSNANHMIETGGGRGHHEGVDPGVIAWRSRRGAACDCIRPLRSLYRSDGQAKTARAQDRKRSQGPNPGTAARRSETKDGHPSSQAYSSAALTGSPRRPIKLPTEHTACRQSAWRPNPGRRSTYRSGKSVRTNGATSSCQHAKACWPGKGTQTTAQALRI